MRMGFTTKNLSAAIAYAKVAPEDVTADERRLVLEGSLGYCEAHHNLYRKVTERMLEEEGSGLGTPECPLMSIACKCKDPLCKAIPKITDFEPCKEW